MVGMGAEWTQMGDVGQFMTFRTAVSLKHEAPNDGLFRLSAERT